MQYYQAAISGGACNTMPKAFHSDGRVISNAFWNVMKHYGMVEGEPKYEEKCLTGSQIAVLANTSGLWVAEADFEFLTPAKEGQVFALIYSMKGEELEQFKAPCDGMAFGLRTTPATHAGDWGDFLCQIGRRNY
jgi:predicted deacylase